MKQLGTLGGGNHFIEVCLDTENFVWLMLHSGSRNIGKELAERHISTAKSLWRLIGTSGSRSRLLHSGHAGICGVLERPEVGANLRDEESRDHDDASVEGLQQDVQSSPGVYVRNSRSTVITTTSRSKSTMAKKFSSRARAQSMRQRMCTASSPDRWARNRSSLRDVAWRRVSTPALTAPDARCRAARPSEPSPKTTWRVKPRVLNVAKT